jgi:hypothetical protein
LLQLLPIPSTVVLNSALQDGDASTFLTKDFFDGNISRYLESGIDSTPIRAWRAQICFHLYMLCILCHCCYRFDYTPHATSHNHNTMDIDAVSRGQAILLQRIMAAHTMTDHQAQKVFQELCQVDDGMGETLEQCFGQINKQLTKAFGLEIASISIHQRRYHAVINQHADDIAKKSFQTAGDNAAKKWNAISRTPSEHEYIRQVLQCLVERGGQEDANENDDKLLSSYAAPRLDLINLKNGLKAPYKLNIEDAEQCLANLLAEQWLVVSKSNSDKKRQRRESVKTKIELGPRSFLELPQLLAEFGIPKDELPQTIFYRA